MSFKFYSYEDWIRQHDLNPDDYENCMWCNGSGGNLEDECTFCNGTGEYLYWLYFQQIKSDREKVYRARKEKLIK